MLNLMALLQRHNRCGCLHYTAQVQSQCLFSPLYGANLSGAAMHGLPSTASSGHD